MKSNKTLSPEEMQKRLREHGVSLKPQLRKKMNPFVNEKKKYKFNGFFLSDKPKNELREILEKLGFLDFKFEETDMPNLLKSGVIGRPLKYSKEIMRSIINREKSDEEFGEDLGRASSTIRNVRALWRKKYPELEVK